MWGSKKGDAGPANGSRTKRKEDNIVDAGGISERENESDSWEVMSGDRERKGDVQNNIKGWERYKKESEKETDRDRDAFDAA